MSRSRTVATAAPALAALALALLTAAPPAAAQVFLASEPHPTFTLGPLFVRARIIPEPGPVRVDLMWSVVPPPGGQVRPADLYVLWPGAIVPQPELGPPDPALARYVEARGFSVIDEGRATLRLRKLGGGQRREADVLPGGAPFVTFVREGGPLGLTAPATYVRIPWHEKLAARDVLVGLRMMARNVVTTRRASWIENVLWGERHIVTLSFNDVRQRAVFPFYFEHRDRVVRLADDPAQILVNFTEADRLKIDSVSPPTAGRRISESQENTEVVSLFLDRSEGITPQVLTVQYGHFTALQSWAPVLIPILFFVLGNLAAVVVRTVAEKVSKRLEGHVLFGRPKEEARSEGVVLPRETLARIAPGTTTLDEVLELCGGDVELLEKYPSPDRRTLLYRGRRLVPRGRRRFGWLTTVKAWDVEEQQVDIELEGQVVRDVQARIRRTGVDSPARAPADVSPAAGSRGR